MPRMLEVPAERPMRSLTDVLLPKRPPPEKETEAITEVIAIAVEFVALPPQRRPAFLAEVRKVTSWKQRRLTVEHTPPGSPGYAPLMALLDGLIDASGMVRTKQGDFTEDELRAAEVTLEREDGRTRIVFPIRYPWSRKPDPETGQGGIRAPAVYRNVEDRGPELQSFRVVPKRDIVEKEWWEA